ncbi:type III-A CRISPR-associated RAMP protein Csm3 [Aliarcobacter cryaerophilus]|uniref:type III-A CRISPR-associated RAMP protein Csm3 n=1 Tax=Aliarcobacter cryaerophilus TaxID=28198 RepID=UPI0021B559B4|nr:type III-A CRISPR-associated RAMP protein Csm3 [Aliarcobacter cryaerophilus]MCT7516932.1 type III-A CRISPR-associated RAMP protein Csm3 [Aliarcobacter cryaerophilus]MCT7535691.1 type III-A CRISPR-associated RAMP protein Csm3 [Aliarcobacter cryaerophilus]
MQTKLRILTGLHIGGSDDTMQIGGIDSAVIKREIFANIDGSINYDGTGKKITEPYIPGSSLKGKVRSLLEHSFGLIAEQKIKLRDKAGKPIDSNFAKSLDENLQKKANLIIILFGESAGSGDKSNTKITRAIFRDTFLTKESRKLYLEDKIKLSEEKAENTINRVSVMANPRFMERVPAGVEFDFEVVLRDFQEDKNLPLSKTIELGLLLLQNDALGGGGSRGNGKIEFEKFQNIENLKLKIKELMEEIEKSL